jgi:hypothetical protein
MAARTNSGENLRVMWNIPVSHAYYHKSGRFYMPPRGFPAALCDPNGYVILDSQECLLTDAFSSNDPRVNVRQGISRMPGYVRMR